MWIVWLILGIVLIFVLFIWGFCEYFFKKSFARVEKAQMDNIVKDFDEKFNKSHLKGHYGGILHGREFVKNTPFDEKYITSHDGYKLYARHYHAENPRATVILCHGFRSHGTHDFAMIVEHYLKRNFDVLLISQRAHVESEGKYIAFGQMERFDIMSWRKTIDGPVLLHGLSMGATSVLLAAELPEVSDSIIGVIADCGFDNAKDEFIHVARDMIKIPVHPAVDIIAYMTTKRIGLDMSLSVSEHINDIKVPLLLIHGEKDDFVPYENVKRIYEAFDGEKYIFTQKDAGHAMSYLEDIDGCTAALDEFLKKLPV